MNASDQTDFRRLVLDLCTAVPDTAALRIAGELARLLHLDLQGLFVEDPALSLLAGLPGMREFRLHGPGWEKLDAARMAAESHQVAARAERLLSELSATIGVPSEFETRRGSIAEIIAEAEPTDILLLAEPRRPAERLGETFLQRCRAAYRSAASFLLVPAARAHRHGPVVAVAATANEAGLLTGARIAQRAGEDFVILLTDTTARHAAQERAMEAGLRGEHIRIRMLSHADATAVAHALAGVQPRLLVLTRGSALGGDLDGLLRLASQASAPVLAVEPVINPAGR